MHCSARISRAACRLRHDTTGPLFPGFGQPRFRIADLCCIAAALCQPCVIGRSVATPPTLWTFAGSSRHISGQADLPDAQPPRGPCPPFLRLRRLTAPPLAPSPEWNLADLYPAPDSPALSRDIARADRDTQFFAEKWRGRLAGLAGAEIATAIAAYEALSDLLGRIGSYPASITSATPPTRPARSSMATSTSASTT